MGFPDWIVWCFAYSKEILFALIGVVVWAALVSLVLWVRCCKRKEGA